MAPPNENFGEHRSPVGYVRLYTGLIYPFGTYDEVMVKPPPGNRFALPADSMSMTALGVLVVVTRDATSDPDGVRPARTLIPWSNITYALPPVETAKSGEAK